MKEKPSWYKGTVEGGKGEPVPQDIISGEIDEIKDPVLEELLAEKQFILDSAPDGWEDEIDAEQLQEFRSEIIKWTTEEILRFSRNNDIWADPTYAKALLDVLSGKITPPLN